MQCVNRAECHVVWKKTATRTESSGLSPLSFLSLFFSVIFGVRVCVRASMYERDEEKEKDTE